MGISDDIKPKKSYRYSSRKEKDDFVGDDNDENEDSEPEQEEPKTKEELENDFFEHSSHRRPAPHLEAEPKEPRPIGKVILILMVVALVVVIIFQNFDLIKNLVGDKFNIFSNNQNSATTESNLNLNDNSNDNLNANSNQNLNTNSSNANLNTNTAPVIDKAGVVIQVLNGNGVTGSADKVKSLLISSGYTVSKIANARKFTYPDTLIYYKTGQEAVATDIKATLTGYQTTIENSDTIVGSYDIIVVVGKL